jgi:hypothetical protein
MNTLIMSGKPPNYEYSVQSVLHLSDQPHVRPVYYAWREIRGLCIAHSVFIPNHAKSSFEVKLKLPKKSIAFDLSSHEGDSRCDCRKNSNSLREQRPESVVMVSDAGLKRESVAFEQIPFQNNFKKIKPSDDSGAFLQDNANQLALSEQCSHLHQLLNINLDGKQSLQSPPTISSTSHQNPFPCTANLNTLRDCLVNYFDNGHAFVPGNRFENLWQEQIFHDIGHFLGIITQVEFRTREYNPSNILHRPVLKRKKKLKMFQMIYSKVIKGLQKNFLEQRNKSLNYTTRFKDNREFFEYYFQTLAQENSEDLSAYDHFKNTINSNLSYTFLKRVFQSEKFKADFLDHLNSQFITDYRRERTERISYLFDKWEKLISSAGQSPGRKLEQIKHEINCPNFKFVLDDRTILTYVDKFKTLVTEDFKLRARSKTSASRRTTLL